MDRGPVGLIVLSVALLTLAAPAVSEAQFSPVSRLIAVDATGKRVGKVLDLRALEVSGSPSVAFLAGTQIIRLAVTRSQLMGWGVHLYFESPGCTGAGWVEGSKVSREGPAELIQVPLLGPPGRTAYILDPGGGSGPRVSLSVYPPDGQGCSDVLSYLDGYPMLPLGDLEPLFTPPFSLRTR